MKRFFTYSARYGHGIEAGLRYLFVILFVYAGMSKLLDFETFQVQLAQSPLLSAYAGFVAWAVPLSEFLIAILLLVDRTRVWGLSGFFFLMIMFTTYIVIILNFADFIPCSCGGVLEKMSWGQHLVFNIVFVLVSGVLLFFQLPGNWRRRVLILSSQIVLGVGVVSVLFAFSERKMHRNNAFVRRYVPHPVEKIACFDLGYSSYYFAGAGDGKVYLGNSTAPLLMTTADSGLHDTITTMIELDQMDLPYRAVRIQVAPPMFYVGDGTVPVVLQGAVSDWKAKTLMQGDYYFNLFQAMDNHNVAVQSNSSTNRENILGTLAFGDSVKGIFSHTLLEKQVDGVFDTDGQLLYNDNLNQLIFIYYYRNNYLGISRDLELEFIGTTIDTISKVQLSITENTSKAIRKLGGNSVMVNRATATFGNYLLIDSPRLGKLEPEDMLREANIIDVYNLSNQTYRFSFYLYTHNRQKTRAFIISEGILYALQGNYLLAYRIESKLLH